MNTTENVFWDYDNQHPIGLKLFLEIATTGNLLKLAISGSPSDEECEQAWESIVKKNGEHSGDFRFNNYLGTAQAYAKLIADYNIVKACITKLLFVVDDETIELLKSKGYNIDTSGGRKYEQSLEAANRKSDNLITKIRRKQKELSDMSRKDPAGGSDTGFSKIMANLRVALAPAVISDDITLSEYNEYRKIIKERQANAKKRGKVKQ